MEGKSSNLLSEQQRLETKLSKMLQDVKPPEKDGLLMQCIYRIPPRLRETNPKAYTPRIVSIGPFHKTIDVGKEDSIFESMEKLKLKYLKGFLNRTLLPVENIVVLLKNMEDKIRSCYGAPIKHDSHDFLKMILIDACFMIELFLRSHSYKDWEGKDPLLLKPWMQRDIKKDLILLENQLPFFVLEQIYNLTSINKEFPSFLEITFKYFNTFCLGTVCTKESPKHFTDLLRSSAISSSKLDRRRTNEDKVIHVYSASQLREAGLKFEVSSNKGLLDLTYFDKGVLSMSRLNIDDDTEMVFRNIIAFEHCHLLDTRIITQYVLILDSLINTEKDVNLLVDKKIIVNLMGDANATAAMFNNLCTNVNVPDSSCGYISVCNSLNAFYENPRNKYRAIFVHEYFNTPWKIASTSAAIILLLLTLIQTICSMISLF
ncbi:hypothetical protein VNO78_33069 [Psophocarpus tetragonolobus]|uniref:Uncharacterized protein n=1 Tax=Psophocarpus tetragonolobus TaxID=3891 RepID=A0AAN9RPF5_PSOTE